MKETRILASIFFLTLITLNFLTGLFFVTVDDNVQGPTYSRMAELMPLKYYGVLLLVSAIFMLLALTGTGRRKGWFMVLGGLTGSIGMFLYASASTLGAVNLMMPSRYTVLSLACLSIAVVGVLRIWKKSMQPK